MCYARKPHFRVLRRGGWSREGRQEEEGEDHAEAQSSRRGIGLGRVGVYPTLKGGDAGESGGSLRRGGGEVVSSAEGDKEEQERRSAFHSSEVGLGKNQQDLCRGGTGIIWAALFGFLLFANSLTPWNSPAPRPFLGLFCGKIGNRKSQ